MPTLRPVTDWPLVICGPMLRRVTPDSVCVFVALSKAARVTLTVYREEPAGSENYVPIGSVTNDTVSLGVNLHVLAATAPVPAAHMLVPGEIYSYNLAFDLGAGGTATTLVSDQFTGTNAIGYGGRLPSFAMPPSLGKLKLVHGSCRKSGGEGTDMLPLLDRLIEKDHLDPFARPHQLLLTGDQIYADDVPACLLTTLRETAAQMLGWAQPETIAWDGGTLVADDVRLRPGHAREDYADRHKPCDPSTAASRQAGNGFLTRLEFMYSQTDFSSIEADAHLIFLGEFYVQYLMAWSPELWPRSANPNFIDPFDPYTSAKDNPQPYDLATILETFPDPLSADRLYERAQLDYRKTAVDTRRRARLFAKGLPAVRRALANVPTYMIMDDHEVTDDWNLDRSWRDSVVANSAGQQIVRNGLVAFAVFQDWGNQPDQYASGPGRLLLDGINTGAAQVPDIVTHPRSLDAILRIQAASVDPNSTTVLHWDHVAYGAAHQVLFLDSRTWRGLSTRTHGKAPAALIMPASLERQFRTPRLKPDLLTLVVAPGPVIGMNRVEFAQAGLGLFEGPEAVDRETWEGHEWCFGAVLQRLIERSPAIILSGDVHYAFAKHLSVRRWDPPKAARIVQLNCSALRNEANLTRMLGGSVSPWHSSSVFEDSIDPDSQELGRALERHFDAAATAAAADAAVDPMYVDGLYRTLLELRRLITLNLPPVVDDQLIGLEYEQARLMIEQYARGIRQRWSYHETGVDDPSRLFVLDATTMAEDPDQSDEFRFVAEMARRSPYVIGKNNLATVTFELAPPPDTNPEAVLQTLYWLEPIKSINRDELLSFTARAPLTPPLL